MKFIKEILWIIIAILIAVIVQFPIVTKIDYKYLVLNTLVIVLSVLYSRMFLDFNNIFYLKNKWVRFLIFALNFFILVTLIGKIQKIKALFDNFTINSFSNQISLLDLKVETKLIHYINDEFLIFGVLAIAATILFSIRILKSFWTKKSISDF